MDGHAAVPHPQDGQHHFAQPLLPGIVGGHRVIVDHQLDAVAVQALPLDVIDDLVAEEGVLLPVHLHMDAGEALAGAVVVDHQVMVAQNFGAVLDVVHNQLPQGRIRRLAQQGRHRILRQLCAADQDENRHRQAHPAVHIPAGEMLDHRGDQHGGSGQHIVTAVGGSGRQGRGADEGAELGVEQAHPQLHRNGADQDRRRQAGEGHRGGMQDLFHRGLAQFVTDQNDDHGHRQTGQILPPGVAVGVVGIGRLLRQLEAQQRHDGAHRVGQVVQSVRRDGNGGCQGTGDQLQRGQQQVADDARNAGELAHRRPDTGLLIPIRITCGKPQ